MRARCPRATSSRQSARPGGHPTGGGQGDQEVPGAVQVEHGDRQGVEPGHGRARDGPGSGPASGPRPGRRGRPPARSTSAVRAMWASTTSAGHPGGVDAGGGQHPAHRPLGGGAGRGGRRGTAPPPRAPSRPRSWPARRGWTSPSRPVGQGRVDEHEAGHPVGDGRRGQGGHQPAERVAHQDDRSVRHPVEEAGHQVHVAGDVGRRPRPGCARGRAGRRPPAGCGRPGGGERRPVEVGAAEAVDGDQQRRVGRTAEVGVVRRDRRRRRWPSGGGTPRSPSRGYRAP